MSLQVLNIPPSNGRVDFTFPLIVSKAPVLSSPIRRKPSPTESQKALFTLLEKRRERYLALRDNEAIENDSSGVIFQDSTESKETVVNDTVPQRDIMLHSKRKENITKPRFHRRNKIPTIASVFPVGRSLMRPQSQLNPSSCSDGDATKSPHNQEDGKGTQNLLSNLECTELAEHVVNCAKVRLKQRRKNNKKLLPLRQCRRETSAANLHSEQNSSAVAMPTTINRPKSSLAIPSVRSRRLHTKEENDHLITPCVKHSLEKLNQCRSAVSTVAEVRRKVVYLSEKQSTTPKGTGVPNVPPVTPSASYSESFKFVLSMSDLKSQKQLKDRLHKISERLKENSKGSSSAEAKEREQRKEREAVMKLKEQQRAEIYALNKIMREFEEQKFQTFMSGRV